VFERSAGAALSAEFRHRQNEGVKFKLLPWWGRLLVYAVIYGVLVALLEPYKPPNTPLKNGLISAGVFILLVGPVMRWSSRRRARKAAAAVGNGPAAAT
jgi:hypothetical protein